MSLTSECRARLLHGISRKGSSGTELMEGLPAASAAKPVLQAHVIVRASAMRCMTDEACSLLPLQFYYF